MPSDTLIHDYIAGALGGMYMRIFEQAPYSTKRICEQLRLRRSYIFAQTRFNLRCSHTLSREVHIKM